MSKLLSQRNSGKNHVRISSTERKWQIVFILALKGPQTIYRLAKNISDITEENIEAARRAIYRNISSLINNGYIISVGTLHELSPYTFIFLYEINNGLVYIPIYGLEQRFKKQAEGLTEACRSCDTLADSRISLEKIEEIIRHPAKILKENFYLIERPLEDVLKEKSISVDEIYVNEERMEKLGLNPKVAYDRVFYYIVLIYLTNIFEDCEVETLKTLLKKMKSPVVKYLITMELEYHIVHDPEGLKDILQLYKDIIVEKESQYITLSFEELYEAKEHLKKAIKLYSELIKALRSN